MHQLSGLLLVDHHFENLATANWHVQIGMAARRRADEPGLAIAIMRVPIHFLDRKPNPPENIFTVMRLALEMKGRGSSRHFASRGGVTPPLQHQLTGFPA